MVVRMRTRREIHKVIGNLYEEKRKSYYPETISCIREKIRLLKWVLGGE